MRICRSGADARSVRLDLLEEIRRVVSFDAYAWLLTDPQTSVGAAPLADVPCLPELPDLIRLKYLTGLNRWTALRSPVGLLTEASGGDLTRSLVWRDILSRYDVGDVASSVYRDQYGCWGFLDLWRVGGRFTASEAAFLADIAAPVTAALRHAQANTFLAAPETARAARSCCCSPRTSRLRAQTPETQHYLRVLVPPDDDRSPVPAAPTTSPGSCSPPKPASIRTRRKRAYTWPPDSG